jgi:tRNA pseudouridine38-40 synthase
MQKALDIFQGFHDFISFADKRMDKDSSTETNMEEVELREFGDIIALRVVASHFLWKMVRRIVGVVVETGRGNFTYSDIELMLDSYSEIPARFTAPPSGLFLERVLYQGDKLPQIRLPIYLLREEN